MGSSQSTQTGTQQGLGQSDTLRLAMANLQRRAGATTGGCDSANYFGGAADADPAKGLREYESSLSAKAKEDVIRRIANALKRVGIKVDPDADLDEIVKQLVAQIPNPRLKNGKFKPDAASQIQVCNIVAEVLNDEFTPGVTKHSEQFIDLSLSPEELCRQVGEWAHSFAVGVNTEFLAVHASVKNSLRNLEILEQVMAEVYNKIKGRVDEAGDAKLSRETNPLHDIYARAQNERRRQEEMLKNILHVQLAPAAKELEIAMRDESEQNALIKKLGIKPGTSEFAETLANAISGLGTAASVAARVHKALKRVGLSVRQYLDSAEFADFQRLLDAKIESGTIKADDLAEFIRSMDTLRRAFSDRGSAQFRTALEGAAATGGARGGDDEPRSTMDKRVEKTRTEKTVIIRDFVGRMTRHYDEVLAAVKSLAPELGKKIPVSDKTDVLRDALTRLRDMREERIELALVGLYTDAAARERKERFLSSLRQVSTACASLMELEMYRGASPYFARLKAAIDALEKTVDYFSDVITKKFGGDADDDAAEAAALYEGGRKHGGAGDDDFFPEISRSSLSLNDAVNEFSYYYYVARVRSNMAQSSKELDVFGEKYVEVLGDAVAARLWHLRQTRMQIETYMNAAGGRAVAGSALNAAFGAPSTAGAPNAAGDAKFEAAKQWVADEYTAKEKLYKAIQAMDLYMKAFTSGIVNDPDAVRDIKKMLDGTQVIARWFGESTGDSLWKAFEHMGATNFAGAKVAAAQGADVLNTAAGAAGAATNPHYYDKVRAAVAAGTAFGIPQLGVDATAANAAHKDVKDTLEFFQALKNLVNAFARIGDKFGGREIRTQVFMSPTQIYKALMDYLKQSAMSINAGEGAAPAAKAASVPVQGAAVNVAGAVAPYEVFFGSVQTGLAGNYETEDRYFSLIIKAMAAKILTVLGVYDMFERRSPIYTLTPTRLIIGGGDEDPEIVEGATELYFRLPRLVEFYRGFLYWNGEGETYKIAMLPEVEGIFSGIIRLVFQKKTDLSSGDYSESELRTLVREINLIHAHFHSKDGERAVQAAMSALVMEVNRRYGIIKGDEMKKYWELVGRAHRQGEWGQFNDTSYAILPGEDETDVDRRAPSDRYAQLGAAATTAAGGPPREFAGRPMLDEANQYNAVESRRMMLRKLRSDLEKKFQAAMGDNPSQFGKTSFSLLIKQAESEIRRSASKEAKLAVVAKLIQGTNVVSLDANKAFMFHETVIVGLNTLGAIHMMIDRFSEQVDLYNAATAENEVMSALYTAAVAGAPPLTINKAWLVALTAGVQKYARFITEGSSDALVTGLQNPLLAMRAGLPGNVGARQFYEFWRLEGTYINATAGAKFASPQVPTSEDGLNVGQLRTLRALRLFARMVVDYNRMMREFVENMFDAAATGAGLVEIRFPQGAAASVQISFSKMRALAESLLSDVKSYMDQFRPFIPADVMKRFEDSAEVGSVFWLEKNLVDRRFRGLSDAVGDQRETLEGISRRASDAFTALTRDTRVAVTAAVTRAALVDATAGTRGAVLVDPAPANEASRTESYGRALSEIVYYDATQQDSAQTGVGTAGSYGLDALVAKERVGNAAPARPTGVGGAALNRFSLYGSAEGMTRHRSLMMAFNQILARYLEVLSDPSGARKIYLNLINAYANGVASRSVSSPDGYSFPDLSSEVFGRRGDPQAGRGAVLFQSLAYVLQRLVKDVNRTTQVSEHLVTTLTDVPLYLKEGFRVNLPGFVRFFELIVQKGEFIKQLVQKTRINCARPDQAVIAGAAAGTKVRVTAADIAAANAPQFTSGSLDALHPLSAMDSEGMKVRLVEIIEAISTGAYTLASSATDVLKELNDKPVYFQTQEGSIESYKSRYSRMPLMPLSLTLFFLNDLKAAGTGFDDLKLFPKVALGEPEFKVQYGVRGLLIRQGPAEFDRMPGVRAALDAYNGVSAKREQLDPARYQTFVKNVVATMAYVTEARNYKSALSTTSQVFSFGSLLGTVIRPFAGGVGNASFAIGAGKTEQMIVTLVENSNQDDEMNKMVAVAGGVSMVGRQGGREMERILNLVDMNIIPINVHALMRDVPLANLFNYEYTFEQMVAALYGESASAYTDGNAAATTANTLQTRQMLLRLLVNPYLDIGNGNAAESEKLYGSDVLDLGSAGYVHRIFRGDNNLGVGRPKFLSDQLFNKALFGSTYQARSDYDEAGPGVGAGIARGQANAFMVPAQNQAAPDDWRAQNDGALTRPLIMGYRAQRITYLKAPDAGAGPETAVKEVDVGSFANKARLEAIGRMRFDTRFVRNIFFISNVLRLVRLKLNRELSQSRNVLLSSHSAVAPGLTEFGADPFGPNEVLGTTLPIVGSATGMSRFSDGDQY